MNDIVLAHFEAVIFDMDGVLIDSEPIWKIAMESVFHSVGCNLSRKDFQKTVGLRIDEVIDYWYAVSPWPNVSIKEVENAIVSKMVDLISEKGVPLEGVINTLYYLKEKGIKIGLATSSYQVLIETVLNTLNIASFFDVAHSAEFEALGKPHPVVYLSTAAMLNVSPHKCLVIEDSLNGVISGKAAGMTVVCIPEKSHEPNPKLVLADMQFESMNDFLKMLQKTK